MKIKIARFKQFRAVIRKMRKQIKKYLRIFKVGCKITL